MATSRTITRDVFFDTAVQTFQRAIDEKRISVARKLKPNRKKLIIEFCHPNGVPNGMGCEMQSTWEIFSQLTSPSMSLLEGMMKSLLDTVNEPPAVQAKLAEEEWNKLELTVRNKEFFQGQFKDIKYGPDENPVDDQSAMWQIAMGICNKPVQYEIEGVPFLFYNLVNKTKEGKYEFQCLQDVIFFSKFGLSQEDALHEARIKLRKKLGFYPPDLWQREERCKIMHPSGDYEVYRANPRRVPVHAASLISIPTDISNLSTKGSRVVMVPSIHKILVTGSENLEGMLEMGKEALRLYKEAKTEDKLSLKPLRLLNLREGPGEGVFKWRPYVPNMRTEYNVPENDAQVKWLRQETGDFHKKKNKKPPRFITTTMGEQLGASPLAISRSTDMYNDISDKPQLGDTVLMQKVCYECGMSKDQGNVRLSKCQGCFIVYYCGQLCQKTNWNAHKLQCNALAKTNGK